MAVTRSQRQKLTSRDEGEKDPTQETEPKTHEKKPKTNEKKPKTPKRKSQEPKPKPRETEPKTQETESKTNEKKPKTPKRKSQEHKPKPQETEPQTQETETETQETEPKIQETEPKTQETEPKIQETKPKIKGGHKKKPVEESSLREEVEQAFWVCKPSTSKVDKAKRRRPADSTTGAEDVYQMPEIPVITNKDKTNTGKKKKPSKANSEKPAPELSRKKAVREPTPESESD